MNKNEKNELELEEHKRRKIAIFEGSAKIGEVLAPFVSIQLRPEDLSSPISFQMALSRIYSALLKSMESGPKKSYVAEVRFRDSLGQEVILAINLGETPPPFTKQYVKARILIELYEEE